MGLARKRLDDEQWKLVEDSLYDRARPGGPATRNFIVFSLLSSAIASMGLLLNSAPAVIGAMLLGPFITSLLAIAGALIHGWGRRLANAGAMLAIGIAMSMLSSFIVGKVFAPRLADAQLPSQLLALTKPGLLDLGIALLAGLAAGYATLRTEAAGALSGVAVSVTLEPPLAAMGLFLASRDGDAFRQAGLAFVTNLGALVLGATVALAWFGFADRSKRGTRTQAGIGIAIWVALVIAVTVPLAVYSQRVIRNTAFEVQVGQSVRDWDPSVHIVTLDAQVAKGGATVHLEITGPRKPEPAWRLAEILSDKRGSRVSVSVSFTLTSEDEALSTR